MLNITTTFKTVNKSIANVLNTYNTQIQESYRPLFKDNADEVIAVTYGVMAISTVQYLIDLKTHGYKYAQRNNAKLAIGLLAWQLVKVPEVENKIAQTLEKLSDKIVSK